MDIVFATDSVIASSSTGASVSVVKGTHWPADDPIVKAYPDLFTDDPRYGLYSSRPFDEDGYPVGSIASRATETASAAPGEKRTRSTAK